MVMDRLLEPKLNMQHFRASSQAICRFVCFSIYRVLMSRSWLRDCVWLQAVMSKSHPSVAEEDLKPFEEFTESYGQEGV